MRDQDLSTSGTSMSPEDLQALLARAQASPTPAPAQPNAGLEGEALQRAVGQAPGPVATTGVNPNNPGPADIGPNGPSLFNRVSNQMQNQQVAGNLPMTTAPIDTPDKISDTTLKKASDIAEKSPDKTASKPTNSYGQLPQGASDELKNAQEARDRMLMIAGLGKAGSAIGAGIAGLGAKALVKDNTDWSDITKMANNKVSDVLEKEKLTSEQLKDMTSQAQLAKLQAGQDPSSNESMATRKALENIPAYKKIIDHMGDQWDLLSAEDIKNNLANPLALYERSEDRKVQYAQMAQMKQLAMGQKLDTDTDKRFAAANKAITAETASSRSVLGTTSRTYNAAEKLQTLLAGRDPNDLNQREIAEMARQMDAILSNGSPTISGMNKLIPSASAKDVSAITEYLTNHVQGANMGSFVTQMMSTVQREKDLAAQQMKTGQRHALGGYMDLQKKDPARWNEMMQTHDLPPEVLSNEAPYTQDVINYAKKFGITNEQALQHKMNRTQGNQ